MQHLPMFQAALKAAFPIAVLAAAMTLTACKQDPAPSAGTAAAGPTNEKAPEAYKAVFTTSKGDFTVQVTRAWAPVGADRFYSLVKSGFFNEARFFRVVDGFMVQFGIAGDPAVNAKWQAEIKDDPANQSNKRSFITFATKGPNTRTTQVFINFVDNTNLDKMGFTPFGQVTDGMGIVDSLYKGYGEGAPRGRGPDQGRLQSEGNAYLKKDFPQLDWIKEAKIAE